jgi:hypothetical protein
MPSSPWWVEPQKRTTNLCRLTLCGDAALQRSFGGQGGRIIFSRVSAFHSRLLLDPPCEFIRIFRARRTRVVNTMKGELLLVLKKQFLHDACAGL